MWFYEHFLTFYTYQSDIILLKDTEHSIRKSNKKVRKSNKKATLPLYNVCYRENAGNGVVKLSILIYDEDSKLRMKTADIIMQVYKEDDCDIELYSFDDPDKAVLCAADGSIETAFISVEDKSGRGFYLTKKLRKLDPQINLISMASRLRFGQELISLRISGYILGERTKEKIMEELDNFRN